MNTRANTAATATAALQQLRICDLTTGFTGPSATRWLAAFGAQVIKIEDLANPDPTRLLPPQAPGQPGTEENLDRSATFNNLNVGKLNLAVNLGGRRGRQIVAELAAISQVICVDYPGLGGVGLDLDDINDLRQRNESEQTADLSPIETPEPIIAVGPEHDDRDPVRWLDLVSAILSAVYRQQEADTGTGFTVLSTTVDHRANLDAAADSDAQSDGSDNQPPLYPCRDGHVAIECRDNGDRAALAVTMGFDIDEATQAGLALTSQDIADWTKVRSRWAVESELRGVGVPVAAVRQPDERVDGDIATGARLLWPMVDHAELGGVRVEGLAVELSRTSWSITEPAPLLGQDTHWVLSQLLGHPEPEIERLQHLGVIS